jgi:hypothetical protein
MRNLCYSVIVFVGIFVVACAAENESSSSAIGGTSSTDTNHANTGGSSASTTKSSVTGGNSGQNLTSVSTVSTGGVPTTSDTSTGGRPPAGGSGTGGVTSTKPGTQAPSYTCSSSSDLCTCMQSMLPSTTPAPECSVVSKNGYCCADSNYPTTGSCNCRHWVCAEDSSSCNCSTSEKSGTSKCLKSYATCCMNQVGNASSCMCDNLPMGCDSGWTEVANCDVAEVTCGSGYTRATSCTN